MAWIPEMVVYNVHHICIQYIYTIYMYIYIYHTYIYTYYIYICIYVFIHRSWAENTSSGLLIRLTFAEVLVSESWIRPTAIWNIWWFNMIDPIDPIDPIDHEILGYFGAYYLSRWGSIVWSTHARDSQKFAFRARTGTGEVEEAWRLLPLWPQLNSVRHALYNCTRGRDEVWLKNYSGGCTKRQIDQLTECSLHLGTVVTQRFQPFLAVSHLGIHLNHREVAHSTSHAEMLPGTVCLAHVPPKSQGGPVWGQLEVIREKIHGCLCMYTHMYTYL